MRKLTITVGIIGASLIGLQAVAQTTPSTPTTPPLAMPAPMSTTADPIYMSTSDATNWRSSDLIGKAVYSRGNERVGEIDELLLSKDGRIVAAVVGVGGFLGMGERKVAIAFPAMNMTRETNGNAKLSVDVSKDMLKAAPEYKPTKSM